MYNIVHRDSGIIMFSGTEQETIKHWEKYYSGTVGIFSHYIENEKGQPAKFSIDGTKLILECEV
jgi:hypothetical protein